MEENLISYAAGLATGLCGVFVTHYLSVKRDKRKEHNKAVEEFRAAFIPDISKIRDLNVYDADSGVALGDQKVIDILVKSYDKHFLAKAAFEHHLNSLQRGAFQAAWEEYTQEPKDGEPKSKFLIYESEGVRETETQCRRDALVRLERLISFASYVDP